LSIVGVREGDQLRRPSGIDGPLRLKLSTLGGSGRRWWFLNGTPLVSTAPEESFSQAFRRSGRHQLSVLDEAGQTTRLEFTVTD
ncbi:penicillin-binding protein 1C, partial [Pseudomonas sp. BN415]|nr:penicillin-binding protein 1C [Pseudomonas sp. BN415]